MVATKLTAAVRYAGLSNWAFYWVPTIADKAAPSRTELDAGTDLSDEISAAAGWEIDRDTIDAPDIGGGFTVQLAGRFTPGSPSLTIYKSATASGTVHDIRALLSDGLDGTSPSTGYIVRFDVGDVAGSFMNVYPVTVRSMVDEESADNPDTVTVNFRMTATPQKKIVVPAAAG